MCGQQLLLKKKQLNSLLIFITPFGQQNKQKINFVP